MCLSILILTSYTTSHTMSIQISFLLRMVEMIGKHPPINVLKTSADVSALDMSLDDDDDDADIYGNDVDEKEARVST